jgi:hypothetical protein
VWRVKRLAMLLALCSSCYSATIHLSPNRVEMPPDLPDSWHVSIFGIFELSDPVPLGVCPYGPNAIEESMGVLGVLVAAAVGIQIMDTSVTCEPSPPPMPGPPPLPPQAPPGPPGGF